MVQREVAERIAAPPGGMSYLSRLRPVPRPGPDRVRRPAGGVRAGARGPVGGDRRRAVPGRRPARRRRAPRTRCGGSSRPAFRERRKMLHNVLSRQLPVEPARVDAALAAAGIAPDRRPQTLAVGEWLALLEALGEIGRRPARAGGMTRPPPIPPGAVTPVVRLAPAKLNLTLAVVGRRPDGYHALHSVLVPLGARRPAEPRGRPSPGARDTPPRRRVRRRAGRRQPRPPGARGDPRAALRRPARPRPPPALAARLDKRIPVAAGLAGGSAATPPRPSTARSRRGARELDDERAGRGWPLDSARDVPFFLAGGPALVEGRGERVAPLHGLARAEPPGRRCSSRRPSPSHTADGVRGLSTARCASPGDGAVRLSRRTSPSEFGSGLTAATSCVARAGVLAVGQRPPAGRPRSSSPASCRSGGR